MTLLRALLLEYLRILIDFPGSRYWLSQQKDRATVTHTSLSPAAHLSVVPHSSGNKLLFSERPTGQSQALYRRHKETYLNSKSSPREFWRAGNAPGSGGEGEKRQEVKEKISHPILCLESSALGSACSLPSRFLLIAGSLTSAALRIF